MSAIRTLKLPAPVPLTTTRYRPPKKNIPQTKLERDHLLAKVREYVEREKPVPPMPLDELRVHAEVLLKETGTADTYLHYTAVLLNNEMWRETLATIPFERRLLLMPKCLRVEEKCPAPFDEFGLLCKQCGLCTIQDFQNEAERLGYAVLVAEGSAVVMSLIQTGQIEAIVGISCLPVLERTFPYVEAAAVPSIAIPLLQDDCINTTVDIDWVWDMIHLTAEDKTRRLNLNALHEEVKGWFSPASINDLMGEADGEAETLARAWLARTGKRWRPFLTAAAYQALCDDPARPVPHGVRALALAVECFHKASLIHDDIEDEDVERYGEATMHAEHGVAMALNAGDLLLGEGYRLLAEADFAPETTRDLLRIAAEGQRQLCRGQGAELAWARQPKPLAHKEVLEIHRLKTSPAFAVALLFGASAAGHLEEVREVLQGFSDNLGIAYQIRDDMDDLGDDTAFRTRPSAPLALARERSTGDDKIWLDALWTSSVVAEPGSASRVRTIARTSGADERCELLLESYKEAAIRTLQDVGNANLKGLLRRVVGKIFNDLKIEGWCGEFEQKNKPQE